MIRVIKYWKNIRMPEILMEIKKDVVKAKIITLDNEIFFNLLNLFKILQLK